MSFSLKIIGCIFILISGALCGISVSGRYLKREKILKEFLVGFDKAACRLKRGGADRAKIIGESFGDVAFIDKNGKIIFSQCGLKSDDRKILEEFFRFSGMRARKKN